MSIISGIAGSEAQKSAANTAGDAATYSAEQSAAIQKYMFDKLQTIQEPYDKLGKGEQGIGAFNAADPTGGAQQYQKDLANMPGLDLPELNLGEFNFAFNPDDPTYKYRQSELTKTIDQAAAARGNYNSRPTMNAQAQGNIALTADESEKQFGRALNAYSTNIGTALSQFGADYQGATDTYNSGYGKMTDLYNMSMNTGSADYNKILDAIKVGQGAAGQTGAGAQATGQGLANTYGQLGQQLGQSAIGRGQATSDMWGNIGATNTSAATMAMLYAFSDIRLKKNVKKIGKYRGMDVIEFSYLWDNIKRIGLIAQQVMKVVPEAVGESFGYLYVNYSLI